MTNPRDKLDKEFHRRLDDIREYHRRQIEDLLYWYRIEVAKLNEPVLIQTEWGVLFG